MFEDVVVRPARKRWGTFLLIGTVAGHAAVLSALVIAAFWKIDKLPVNDDRQVVLAVMNLPAPAAAPPPGGSLEVQRRPTKIITKDVVQPEVAKTATPPEPATPGNPGNGVPDGTGTDPTGTGTDPTGTGTCLEPPCGDVKPDPEPIVEVKQPEPPKTVVVPPNVAAGLRLSGTEKIYPPDSVRVAMVHGGEDKLQGTIKLCVTTAGSVDSVKVLKSTGHDAYDAALVSEMRRWRYRPYQVNGVAAPMCTVQVVIYRMTR